MKKEPEKKPVPQEPKKDNYGWKDCFFVGCIIGIFVFDIFICFDIGDMRHDLSEANRLLSIFQRIDTVKDEVDYQRTLDIDGSEVCYTETHRKIVCPPLGETLTKPIYLPDPLRDKIVGERCEGDGSEKCFRGVKIPDPLIKPDGTVVCHGCSSWGETDDPNLCKQWKTICNDGPVGPQCDVICRLNDQ